MRGLSGLNYGGIMDAGKGCPPHLWRQEDMDRAAAAKDRAERLAAIARADADGWRRKHAVASAERDLWMHRHEKAEDAGFRLTEEVLALRRRLGRYAFAVRSVSEVLAAATTAAGLSYAVSILLAR